MTNLAQFELPEDIRSEFKVNEYGQCTCSIRGAGRLLNIKRQVLDYSFKSAQEDGKKQPTKLAKKLMEKGWTPEQKQQPVTLVAGVSI